VRRPSQDAPRSARTLGTDPVGWRSMSMVMCRLSLAVMLLVLALRPVHAEIGIAAFYGGGRTASGEVSGPNGLTAAHRTFPFGTKVLVTNVRNGRTVRVRINDRGPFASTIAGDMVAVVSST
jgi:rare lipoprotein A